MRIVRTLFQSLDHAHRQVHMFVACVVGFAVLLVGSALIAWQTDRQHSDQVRVYERAIAVLRVADRIEIAALNMIRGERGYLLSGNEEFLETYYKGAVELSHASNRLEQLTVTDEGQRRNAEKVAAAAATFRALLDSVVARMAANLPDRAISMVKTGQTRTAIGGIVGDLDAIRQAETRQLAGLSQHMAVLRSNHLRFLGMAFFAGISLLVFSTFTVTVRHRSFQREAQFRESLRRLANTDELTGIANRRELNANLGRAIAAARRRKEPLALAILDIDHFKNINDTYGHAAGDEVIRKIARSALAAVRGCDIVGRIGGEEFAIILPGAGTAAAYTVCERVRDRINGEPIDLSDGRRLSITASTGIARLMPDDTLQTLMARADTALYDAKNGGRDQVRMAA